MWNLLRCLLKTLVALLIDDVLISGSLTITVAATVRSYGSPWRWCRFESLRKVRFHFEALQRIGAASTHRESSVLLRSIAKIVPIRGASNIGADSRHLREVRC